MRASTKTGLSACYPLIFSVSCLLFLLHKLFPSLFAYLVCSSPVLACTFLLLGILLIHGDPSVPRSEKEEDGGTAQATSKAHPSGVFRRRGSRISKEKIVLSGDGKVDDANGVTQVESASVDSNSCLEDDEGGKSKNTAASEGKTTAAKSEDFLDSCSAPPASTSSGIKTEDEDKRNSQVPSAASLLNELDRLFESDHGVLDEEEEEDVDDDDDDDDEVTQEGKEDVSKAAAKFSIDDQRVILELSRSELERNRQLERILTWRRTRQGREKNEGHHQQSQGHLPFLYAPRRNPLALPRDSDEPASAPTMFHPRRNPFGLPCNQEESAGEDSSSLGNRDMFRRCDSFTGGEKKRHSRLKPHSGAEMNKQFSKTGDSKTEQDSLEMVHHQDRESLSSSSRAEIGKDASEAFDESANNAADEGRLNRPCLKLKRRVIVRRDDRKQKEDSSSGFGWFVPPSMSALDEIESGMKEIAVILESDVMGDELHRLREKDSGGAGFRVEASTSSIREEQSLRSNLPSVNAKAESE